ncbi:MAG: ABC transporter ATP-binding protein [Verrucomicrobiota bacterium]|nr:ABC transporter ATP-binding protein [Verrucomicrobiota bacterium]
MNDVNPKNGAGELSNGDVIRRLLKLSWQFKGRCIQVFILQSCVLSLAILNLRFVGDGIDYLRHVLLGSRAPTFPLGLEPTPGTEPARVILTIAGAVVVAAVLRTFIRYYNDLSLAKLTQLEIVPELRAQVFAKLQRLSFRFFDQNASGSIINRVTGDVQSVRLFIDGVIIQCFLLVLTLSVYLVYMLSSHVWLTLACLSTTPLLGYLSIRFSRTMRPQYKESRRLMDKLILTFSENIQGIATIKGFNLEKFSTKLFEADTEKVRTQQQAIFWKASTFGPLIGFVSQINLIVLLGYGGYLAMHDEITIGGLVVFAGLLQQFSGQVSNIAGVADSIQQSLTGARRVFEILDSPIEIQSKANAIHLPKAKGEMVFENVSFRFTEANTVLHDISFVAHPGEVIAIAGATGAGKSALVSLIPRFYDPLSGRILLDGIDLRDLAVEDLRRNIGLVFQENFLFSNTIAANIAFGHPNASRAQIEKAAKIACAHKFIMESPEGYDTILSESGQNLSGGQRQRLAIARAILLEPTILLLDDPTAAIDPETEHEIMEAIEQAISGRTTFIVAHRLSTLRRANRIIVLEEGRIIQMGTHDELMEQEGLYKEAVSIQAVDPESMRLLRLGAWNKRAK